jgi:hypothetical protein
MQHIQHTAGIYGFFASVAQAVRKEAGHGLCWWETGMVCAKDVTGCMNGGTISGPVRWQHIE